MSTLLPSCDATLTQNGALVECSGNWVLVEVPTQAEFLQLADEGTMFTIADLDSPTLMAAYSAGFTLVAMAWAVSIGFKTVLKMLR